MLTIHVPIAEGLDEATQTFVVTQAVTLEMEHSLVSLSKWESLWETPFLGKEEQTTEQVLSYIELMTLTPNVPPEIFTRLSKENLTVINAYINAKMTATWFRDLPGQRKGGTGEVVTSEIIYYWLVSLQIPFETQEWHLNRLLTLVKVINQKNAPKKKLSKQEALQQQRDLNRRRRQGLGTRG